VHGKFAQANKQLSKFGIRQRVRAIQKRYDILTSLAAPVQLSLQLL
jgi:hypothetical protein